MSDCEQVQICGAATAKYLIRNPGLLGERMGSSQLFRVQGVEVNNIVWSRRHLKVSREIALR